MYCEISKHLSSSNPKSKKVLRPLKWHKIWCICVFTTGNISDLCWRDWKSFFCFWRLEAKIPLSKQRYITENILLTLVRSGLCTDHEPAESNASVHIILHSNYPGSKSEAPKHLNNIYSAWKKYSVSFSAVLYIFHSLLMEMWMEGVRETDTKVWLFFPLFCFWCEMKVTVTLRSEQ